MQARSSIQHQFLTSQMDTALHRQESLSRRVEAVISTKSGQLRINGHGGGQLHSNSERLCTPTQHGAAVVRKVIKGHVLIMEQSEYGE